MAFGPRIQSRRFQELVTIGERRGDRCPAGGYASRSCRRITYLLLQLCPACLPVDISNAGGSYVRALNGPMDRAVGDGPHAYARWLWALADQEMARA